MTVLIGDARRGYRMVGAEANAYVMAWRSRPVAEREAYRKLLLAEAEQSSGHLRRVLTEALRAIGELRGNTNG